MEERTRCAYCRSMIPVKAKVCPHCGAPIKYKVYTGGKGSPELPAYRRTPAEEPFRPGQTEYNKNTSPYTLPNLDLGRDVLPRDKRSRALTQAVAALIVSFFPLFGVIIAGAALASAVSAKKEFPGDRKPVTALVLSVIALCVTVVINVFLFANEALW